MPAGKYDILIEQGADFIIFVTWEDDEENPLSLAGYTAKSQVRYQYNSESPALEFKIDIEPEGEEGTIKLTSTPEETEKIDRDGVWDLEIEKGEDVTRLLMGKMKVSREATK